MDLERTMAFILQQQAEFEADIARHTEVLDQHMKAIGALLEVSRLQSNHTERLDRALAVMGEAHNRLAGVHEETDRRLAEVQEETAEAHKRLARAQEETERRLNDFIAQVSRYLAGGNGRQRGPGTPGGE